GSVTSGDLNYNAIDSESLTFTNIALDLKVSLSASASLSQVGDAYIYDPMVQSSRTINFTGSGGLYDNFSWTITKEPSQNGALGSSNKTTVSGSGKYATMNVGLVAGQYFVRMKDLDTVLYYDFSVFVQGSPLPTKYERKKLDVVRVFFTDYQPTNRKYQVYYSRTGNAPWLPLLSAAKTPSKPSSQKARMATTVNTDEVYLDVNYEGSLEAYFKVLAVAEVNGETVTTDDLPDDLLKTETYYAPLPAEVLTEDTPLVNDFIGTASGGGGGCLIGR
ncbi:MAG: hypothetical protein HQL31_12760, partial [Planctomycetes bacterium]|nr:hypothetical protein [Planctomycetota bacterium]